MSVLRFMDHPVYTYAGGRSREAAALHCTAYILLLYTRTQTAEWIVGALVTLVKTIYIRTIYIYIYNHVQ